MLWRFEGFEGFVLCKFLALEEAAGMPGYIPGSWLRSEIIECTPQSAVIRN